MPISHIVTKTNGLMYWSNYLHHLLYLLYSTQTVSALSFHQTGSFDANASPIFFLPPALNDTSKAQYLDYLCTDEGSPNRNRPLGKDCDIIMDYLMPLSTDSHKFHGSSGQNDQDIYKLPYQEEFGSCTAVLDLVPGFTEETSSWLYIRAIATALTTRCVYVGPGFGGRVSIGSDSGIFVSVFGSLRENVQGNEMNS